MNSQKIIITENFTPDIKNALYSNFSNAVEAIMEILDNSVSNRVPEKLLQIKIFLIPKSKKIEITDIGGRGMSIKDLEFFWTWGGPKQRTEYDIGRYGQGGKSATGYLGRALNLITSSANSEEEYRIEDPDLLNFTKLKEYHVKTERTTIKEGYTKIEINKVKINLSDNFVNKLKESILKTYRPIIEKRMISISLNGEELKIQKFPLDEKFEKEAIDFRISDTKMVKGWIGRLAAKPGLKGGMRCYYKGRLILEREFFGHPDPSRKATLNYLFGEVHLDFLDVNTNKTDFHRDTDEWEEVSKKMFMLLKPHVYELLNRDIEEPTEEDEKRIKNTRELFQVTLQLMKKTAMNQGQILSDFDQGQKKPERQGGNAVKKIIEKQIVRSQYEPKTPPPPDRIGNRRRLRSFMDWDVRPMYETIRSKIQGSNDEKILIINNRFPGYKQSKRSEFYLLETAALQTVPIDDEKLTPIQYLEEFDNFFGEICDNLDQAKEMLQKKKKQI